MDYTSGQYTVTIPAGVTMIAFGVPITDDKVSEGVENFTLTINHSSLPISVTRGTPGQATVTIVDDERKYKICNVIQYEYNYIVTWPSE